MRNFFSERADPSPQILKPTMNPPGVMPQHEASLADLLTAEDFDKTEVLLSSSPYPVSGYAHGVLEDMLPCHV